MENTDNNINLKMCILLGGVMIAISVMIFLYVNSDNKILDDLKNKKKKII